MQSRVVLFIYTDVSARFFSFHRRLRKKRKCVIFFIIIHSVSQLLFFSSFFSRRRVLKVLLLYTHTHTHIYIYIYIYIYMHNGWPVKNKGVGILRISLLYYNLYIFIFFKRYGKQFSRRKSLR